MADFRPFPALRYDPEVAGSASDLLSPPYDVVSAADRAALYARSPFNIAHVDFGEERPNDTDVDNRYTRARERLEAWLAKGVLRQDDPRMYVYEQEFSVHGRRYRRAAVFGRLRLEEWDQGVVLPHEHTLSGPKADRLKLLQATRVNLSPIMAMYRNDSGAPLVQAGDVGGPILDATLASGERHILSPLSDAAAARFRDAMARQRLYIADGHHRYETALAYRAERRDGAPDWSGEEPENFVLAALVDIRDPGLVILPIHRIVSVPARRADAVSALEQHFEVEAVEVGGKDDLQRLMQRLAEAGRTTNAIAIVGLEAGRAHLLRRRASGTPDPVPAGHAEAWRRLDVNVLHHIVFPAVGFDGNPDTIEFTEDHDYAFDAVQTRPDTLAFLLNPTPPEQILACADAGERMPQKTTFFYPKLGTGVVMYPL